ncbi:hypothetical protein GW17_00041415 [Ensete ventricosum]|nr:hypothetical protein GW17_00041415 [Ensete ventricosum]
MKKGSRCVINRNEDLMAIDFNNDIVLVEKEIVQKNAMVMKARAGAVVTASDRLATVEAAKKRRRARLGSDEAGEE